MNADIQQHSWPLEQVDRELEEKLCGAYEAIHRRAQDDGIPLRAAAFMDGVKTVVEALELRGFVTASDARSRD